MIPFRKNTRMKTFFLACDILRMYGQEIGPEKWSEQKKTLTEELQVCNLLFNLKNCRKIDAWAVLDSFFNLVKGVSNLETCVDYFALPGRGCESLNFCCRIILNEILWRQILQPLKTF